MSDRDNKTGVVDRRIILKCSAGLALSATIAPHLAKAASQQSSFAAGQTKDAMDTDEIYFQDRLTLVGDVPTYLEGLYRYGPVIGEDGLVIHEFGFLRGDQVIHSCRGVSAEQEKTSLGALMRKATFASEGPYADEGEGWLLSVRQMKHSTHCELTIRDALDPKRGVLARARIERPIAPGGAGDWQYVLVDVP